MKCSGLVACLTAVTLSLSASAASIEDGSGRSVACQACHGGDGISISADIPNLAGQKTTYLTQQLEAFKSGSRKHDVMNPIAQQLSDTDIENLAAFWNSLPSAGSKRDVAPAALLARQSVMTFPADFPKGFTAYRTDEDAQAQSVSTFYANTVAIQAARGGKPLPNGSIIVVTSSRTKTDAPRSYSAMEARAGWGTELPELLRNGTWSYALFDAQRARRDANHAICFGCHKKVAGDSYVFTAQQLARQAPEQAR